MRTENRAKERERTSIFINEVVQRCRLSFASQHGVFKVCEEQWKLCVNRSHSLVRYSSLRSAALEDQTIHSDAPHKLFKFDSARSTAQSGGEQWAEERGEKRNRIQNTMLGLTFHGAHEALAFILQFRGRAPTTHLQWQFPVLPHWYRLKQTNCAALLGEGNLIVFFSFPRPSLAHGRPERSPF